MKTTQLNPTRACLDWLGREYVANDYDCWGFFRDFYAKELGIGLPVVGVASGDLRKVIEEFGGSSIRAMFTPVEDPQNGDAVLITYSTRPNHVGVYLKMPEGPLVMHNHASSGVVCEPLRGFKANAFSFWRFNGPRDTF